MMGSILDILLLGINDMNSHVKNTMACENHFINIALMNGMESTKFSGQSTSIVILGA